MQSQVLIDPVKILLCNSLYLQYMLECDYRHNSNIFVLNKELTVTVYKSLNLNFNFDCLFGVGEENLLSKKAFVCLGVRTCGFNSSYDM